MATTAIAVATTVRGGDGGEFDRRRRRKAARVMAFGMIRGGEKGKSNSEKKNRAH